MRTFWRVLLCTSALLAAGRPADLFGGATVLLVTDGDGTLAPNESANKSQLESFGYTVTTVWDNADQPTIDAAVAAAHCVLVPYSVNDAELGDKLRFSTKGVVCEERYLDDNFGLSTQAGSDASYTAISITNNTHYITSPFSVGSLTIFSSSQPMALMNDSLASGLLSLADRGGSNKVLSVVEKGATLANTVSGNSTAAGRRVHLPWGGDSFDYTALNANAQTLWLRAIQWAIGDPLQLHYKLNETSGTSVADSSINGRTGTVTGTATWTPGRRHNGFDFNGSTKIEYNGLLNSPTSFTVACWARIDATDSSGAEGVSIGDYVALRLHRVSGNGPAIVFYRGSSNYVMAQFSTSYVGRGWHHYAATFDDVANSLKLYIDGVQVAATTTNYSISWSGLGANTRVGQHGNTNTTYDLDGAVDDVRVYDTALTAAEIAGVYGLVGHWKLAETSGTNAADSSLSAGNGTYTNGPTVAQGGPYPGVGQYAPDFDGSNDFVDGPASTNFSFADGFSIAGWVYLDDYVASSAILQNGASTQNCELSITSTGQVRVSGRSAGGVQSHTTSSTLPRRKWKHVVGTYDGATLKVYIDGVLDSSTANSFAVSTTPAGNLTIGASLEGSDEFWNGKLQDVRLYNRALVLEEVAVLHGLIGHWRLNETSGTVADDASSINNDGTYAGGPTVGQEGPYPGAGQYAPQFDGSNDHVSVPSLEVDLGAGFTICAWARPTATGSNERIIDFGNGSNVDNVILCRVGTSANLRLDIRDGSAGNKTLTATNGIEQNVWRHYVATCDSSGNAKLYCDGQQLAASSGMGTPGNVARKINYIARSNWSGHAYFSGRMHDVRLYNRPLSTAEIAEIYGLVGHWKLDEGSGSNYADSSGMGADAATNSGAPTWIATAPYDNGLQFNGTSDDAITPNVYTPPSVGSVAFWMRPNGTPASTQRLFGLGSDWEVRQYPDGIVYLDLCGDNPVSSNFTTASTPTAANRWYHVVGTYDSTDDSYAVYVNGTLERSGTSIVNMVAQAANQLSIGTRTGTTERFAGAIDDLRIYNRKLSPWEVYQVYGLMGWYKLDETSGTVMADSTGRGKDGTFVGSPTLNVSANGASSQGTAVQFNGSNYARVNDLYDKSSSVSVTAWVRLDGIDSSGADVVSLGNNFVLRLASGANSVSVSYWNGSAWNNVSASQMVQNTGWHHFAAVLRANDTVKIYIDGNLMGSSALIGSVSYTGNGTQTRIAAHGNGSNAYNLTGRIDDVRIYNRAMTPEEVFSQYRGTRINGVRILNWIETR